MTTRSLSLADRMEIHYAKLRSHTVETKSYLKFIRDLSLDRQAAIVRRLCAERREIATEYAALLSESIEQNAIPENLVSEVRGAISEAMRVVAEI